MKYTIEDIKQRSREVKGERMLFMLITYTTEEGYEGTVEISKNKFTEKKVIAIIEEEIKEMVKLTGLKEVII